MDRNRVLNSSQEINMELDAIDSEAITLGDLSDLSGDNQIQIEIHTNRLESSNNGRESNDPNVTDNEEETEDSVTHDENGNNFTSSQESTSSMEVSSQEKKKGGRPKDEIWSNFEKINHERRTWKCNHCSNVFKFPQANRLRQHIESACPHLKKLRRLNKSKTSDSSVSVPMQNVPVPKEPEKDQPIPVHTKQTSLNEHFRKLNATQQERINIKLTKFICSSNVPFAVVENKYFQEFVRELRPLYQLPSAKVVSNSLLDKVFELETQTVINNVSGNKAVLIQDGWSTNQSEAVIAHAMLVNEQIEFLNAVVIEEEKKTALVCLRNLKEAMVEAEQKYKVKIVGIITDNCNTMISMRRSCINEFPDLIAYGCNSHLLNLIGKKMTPENLKNKIVKVQKFFRNHDLPSAYLKNLNGLRPVTPGDTRWNSQIDCFKNYVENQAKYLDISRKKDIDIPLDIKCIITDNDVFQDLEDCIQILSPVAIALDKLQGDKSTVSDAVHCWLELMKTLDKHKESSYIKEQFIKGTPDSSIAAYMVHPKYKGMHLTKHLRDNARLWFMKKDKDFLPILLAFQSEDTSFFSKLILDSNVTLNLHPISWWKTAHADNPTKVTKHFFQICETLLQLPSSTAGLERCFSTLGNIITDSRNRLKVEKAKKICFVNHSLRKQ